MSELVTISKKSSDFESYLLGSFSKDYRALPLQTLNVNSAAETVTFRLMPLDHIKKPSLFLQLLVLFKVRSFLLVIVPMFLILVKNKDLVKDPWVILFSTVGVLFTLVAVNLRNEFMDYVTGADRVLYASGSGVIQKGWVTASQVLKYSNIWLAGALGFGLLVCFAYPKVIVVVLLGLLVGVWAQFKSKGSFKYQIGGEFSLFVLIGPLLTIGYQISMGVAEDTEALAIGIIWGLLVLFLQHLRSFLNIFLSTQVGFTNTINWLGFDRSRRALALWWIITIILLSLYQANYNSYAFAAAVMLGLTAVAVPFIISLKKLSSPAGSEILKTYRLGYFLFLAATATWFAESLWQLLR